MKKVLIIDDSAFARLSLKTMLEKNGYEVVGEAGDALTGVMMYKRLRPDVVTMDITMPDVDGIEGLKLIKKLDTDAKIIMISGMGQEVKVMEAVKNGALAFIVKPFNENIILKSFTQTCLG